MEHEIHWYIEHVGDHYELYIDGKSYCTADTYSEAYSEIREYLKEKGMSR